MVVVSCFEPSAENRFSVRYSITLCRIILLARRMLKLRHCTDVTMREFWQKGGVWRARKMVALSLSPELARDIISHSH